MSRQRSSCVFKKRTYHLEEKIENKIKFEPIEEDPHQDIILETDKFNKEKKVINRQLLKNSNDLHNLTAPVFKNIIKEFPSKSNKVMFIHEKAHVVGKFDRSNVSEIEEHTQIIDFVKFLQQFKTEDEVQNLELQDILDIDHEKLEEIKYKAIEFIDAASLLMDKTENSGHDIESVAELLLFFSTKLQDMKSNEINLQIFVNNLDRVKGIQYSNNGVKVFFKKNIK